MVVWLVRIGFFLARDTEVGMVKDQAALKKRAHLALDLVLTGLAFVAAYYMKRHWLGDMSGLSIDPNYYLVLLATLVCCAISFDFFGFYDPSRGRRFDDVLVRIVKGVGVGTVGVVVLFYLLKEEDVSRLLMGVFFLLNVVLLVISREVVRVIRTHQLKRGVSKREILVVGSRERAKDMIRYVLATEELGYSVVGCLEVSPGAVGTQVTEDVSVIGSMDDFQDVLLNMAVDEVIFAMPLGLIDNVLDHIGFAEEVGVNVRVLPDWQFQKLMYQPEIASVFIEPFAGIPTLALSSTPRKGVELLFKEFIDRASALLGLAILSPLFLLVALMIRLSSEGPVFFRQERSGLNGRVFNMYKFRTMVQDAEKLKKNLAGTNEMDGPVFKMKNDPRVTKIGRFLRKTSLDELPQLINVVMGEMSLVGPRPPLPSEVREYTPWQRRRLSMKPGLTCIWQVSGRNEISFEEWMRMDLEYIDKWSLMLDLKLLFKTVPTVLLGTGR